MNKPLLLGIIWGTLSLIGLSFIGIVAVAICKFLEWQYGG